MLRMFRTINGQVEQIQKPENGSWLCLSDPTDVELANVSMETGVDLADLRKTFRVVFKFLFGVVPTFNICGFSELKVFG